MITATTRAPATDDHQHAGTVLDVVLGWTPDDPCAVALAFPDATNSTWLLSRDMLNEACQSPLMLSRHGSGDVRVIAGPQHLHLMLHGFLPSGPESTLRLTLHRPVVAAFLDRTFAAVPLGAETFDVDALAAGILGRAL